MLWWMVCWYSVFPSSVGLFWHFFCLFVRMSVWSMASNLYVSGCVLVVPEVVC